MHQRPNSSRERVSLRAIALSLTVALALAPSAAHAEEPADAPAGESAAEEASSAPILAATATTLVLAGSAVGLGYGVYLLAEPVGCAEVGPLGGCIRTRTPAGERQDWAIGALVGSSLGLAAGIVGAFATSLLFERPSGGHAPGDAQASLVAPLLYVDGSVVLVGAVGSF